MTRTLFMRRILALLVVVLWLSEGPLPAEAARRRCGANRCEAARCCKARCRKARRTCRPTCASSPRSTTAIKHRPFFDGQSLSGWRIADEADFTAHGKVQVRDGRIELGLGSPATGIVRTSEGPKINYEMSLEAMRTGGGDFFCGLTFPVRDEFCTLIVGGWGGGVVGLSNIDGVPASDNAVANWKEFEDDQWYRIRLRVTEEKIEVWIDDERLIEVVTDEHKYDIWWEQEPMRPLGIATWYTSAAFRNMKLERVALNKSSSQK